MVVKKNLYANADKLLFGGILPGGAAPLGSAQPKQGGIVQGTPQPTATPKDTVTPQPAKDPNKVFRDQGSGAITGVTINGKTYLGLGPADVEQMTKADLQKREGGVNTQAFEKNATAEAAAQEQQAQTQAAMSQIGQLSPEQQALINQDLPTQNVSMAPQITESTIQGAAFGATGGAALGSAVPGLGTAIGAVGGLIGGAISGAVKGTFAAYEKKAVMNTAAIDNNVERAKYNIRQATMMLNKGGDSGLAVETYNNALAQLAQSERLYQLEVLKNEHQWVTKVREKQIALMDYRTNTLPIMQERFILSLQKPDPAYVDQGLDSSGNPI